MSGKEKTGLLIAFAVVAGVWIAVQGASPRPEGIFSQQESEGILPFQTQKVVVKDADVLDSAKDAVMVISGPEAAAQPEPAKKKETASFASNKKEAEKIVATKENQKRAAKSVEDVIKNNRKQVVRYRSYEVKKGESLSKIAVKIYGKGDLSEKVEKIYSANKDVLKSKNNVIAGQELKIPPDNELSDSDSLKKLAKNHSGSLEYTQAGSSKRTYVVKDGDSLWKIAKKKLGKGSRYREIIKLNKDKVSNDKTLKPGVQILLPS
ncbi:LysM peptidoglycan-binding domain-containing protein [Sedimentisphaera salicampi]|uniref:LysM domain/BON superfamily protein n=1 Tax=Sedimentisphaera salicampi TaxID=1941349 RepID=A0A1W6LNJ5_9BACT|nr:LysM peptidoglycan-binding domain-containing protein [Sedimentisphaera salicampi]ARN57334.1 LysM domain/BON superfamily protein [Sedimentisphaera salicampi]OXU14647.1 LysM domain/BON superfamily protein [Sedimentisphaera salicampi]